MTPPPFFLALVFLGTLIHHQGMDKNDLLVDEKTALEIVGVKPSTLRALVRSGLIDPVKYNKGRVRKYYISELRAVKAARLHNRTLVFDIREEVVSLSSQVRTLAHDLRLMAQQIGLNHIGYSPTDTTLIQLYNIALALKGSMAKKRPTIRFFNQWLSAVPLLTEQEYRRLTKLFPGDNLPWRAFYLATEEMLGSLAIHYNLEIDVPMQVMRTRLVLCLDRIHSAALVFLQIEEPKANPARRMTEVLQTPFGTDSSLESRRLLHDLELERLDPDKSVMEMFDAMESETPTPVSAIPPQLDLRATLGRPPRRR